MKYSNSLVTFVVLVILFVSATHAQNYDVKEITAEPYIDIIERTGKIAFKRTLNLSFKSSGYLKKLSVDDGDSFEKGQVLASLDVQELTAIKNSTYAQLIQAKREIKRIEMLREKGLSSEQAHNIAETHVDTARSAYKVAFYNLEKAQVIAPFNGVVLSRHTELGEFQSPGKEILQVAALENNWVIKVALTGNEINDVHVGQKVVVRLPRKGNVVGTVSKIPVMANAEGNLFGIEILLPKLESKNAIIAGQLADVTINTTSNMFVYRIPIESLVKVDNQGRAIVVTQSSLDKKVKQQAYSIFKLDNHYVYLSADELDPSLTIVTRGWQRLLLEAQ